MVSIASHMAQGQNCVTPSGDAGLCQETSGCPDAELWLYPDEGCGPNVRSPLNEINFLQEYCCVPYSSDNPALQCKKFVSGPCENLGGIGKYDGPVSRCCDGHSSILFCDASIKGSIVMLNSCGNGSCVRGLGASCVPPSQ